MCAALGHSYKHRFLMLPGSDVRKARLQDCLRGCLAILTLSFSVSSVFGDITIRGEFSASSLLRAAVSWEIQEPEFLARQSWLQTTTRLDNW